MFGYLRFFLAFLVMISHVGVKVFSLNPGVFAVVIFYLLAGFVVSHLFFDVFAQKKDKILYFYKDRILRIFPLYLYIMCLTLLFLLLTSFGNPDYSLKKMIYNTIVVPLNYYMYVDSTILTKPTWNLIPPAWSLGTELQAYILLPLVFISKRVKILLVLGSFVVFIIANFSFLNPDYFGYRLILGVFFIFYTGSLLQKNSSVNISKFDKNFPLFVYFSIVLLIPILYWLNIFSPTYTKETFVGLLVGMPLILFISKSSIKLPFNALLGSLSYGLFLSHFLSIWVLQYFGKLPSHTLLYLSSILMLSLLFSFSGVYLVEKKTNFIRNIVK